MSVSPHPKTVARRAALRALVETERSDWSPSDFSAVDASVRGFAREIYSGTLRHQSRLDWTLAPVLQKPLQKLDAPVRATLRLALYEKLVLETPTRALANEYSGLMRAEKLGSATGFVNAIARRLPEGWRELPREAAEALSIEFSHPRWLVERYLARFGAEETRLLLQTNNEIATPCLRVITLWTSRAAILEELPDAVLGKWSRDAVYVAGGDLTGSSQWKAGLVIAQDEAAQLVSLLAAPLAGESVLDAASAPGGKTTHLAQLMGDKGTVLALDIAPRRLELVRDNAKRLRINCIDTRTADLRILAHELVSQNHSFDLVLLDAPCLGTGTLRRRPDAKWRKTPEQLEQLVVLQRELLDAAALLVRPGGTLVYSTCSVEREENQGQIEAFLSRSHSWTVERAPEEFLEVATEEGFLNTFPHRHGCDGMFAARLRRTVETT